MYLFLKLAKFAHVDASMISDDQSITPVIALVLFYFLFKSSRRFYGFSKIRTVKSSVLLILGLGVAMQFYRYILFVVTFYELT